MDVVVVGGGPPGRAIAAACADIGLQVTLVDPNPRRAWTRTCAAWQSDLPAAAPVTAVMDRMRAFGTRQHEWAKSYAVVDNVALWKALWRPDVVEVPGKVLSAEHGPTGSTVLLQDGRRIATGVVVDASGSARALSGGRPAHTSAMRTALGIVLDLSDAAAVCPPDSGVFMDWRPAPDTRGGWPTFLHAIRVGAHAVLLSETSLARRPALPLALLRRRLHGRLAAAGIEVPPDGREERLRVPVDDPIPRREGVVTFDAMPGLLHPASELGVATALRSAPWMASAIAAGLATGPAMAVKAARAVLWPTGALTAHRLRRQTLHALLALPPPRVPEFFELMFSLDAVHRTSLLSADPPPYRTIAGLAALAHAAPWSLRRHLVAGGLSPRTRHARHGLGGLESTP